MSEPSRNRPRAAAVVGYAATGLALALILVRILLSGTDPANTSAPAYLPLAFMATAVLVIAFVLAMCVRRIRLDLHPWFPWLVGIVSFVVSLVPFWAIRAGNTDLGGRIYAGLHVPQGIMQFWDLSLVLKSIDCAHFGFDVFAENNGCLQDPAIYGPGMLWLQYVPFRIFSEKNAWWLGILGIAISSLALAWLARRSTGIGQAVLLAAAVGGPWLLLLERGNVDAALIWGAVLVVVVLSRWDRLWAWWAAAAIIWLLGTWKYYPFAMGLMLIPALRLRRGWTVLAGYALAFVAFMALTWSNFAFSSQSNSNMVDYGDFVVLGRVPVVARMLGTVVKAPGLQSNDLLIVLLALVALAWGAAIGLALRKVHMHAAMLAISGTALFLASVLAAGFGWGYKATFLLLAVPLLSTVTRSRHRVVVSSAVLSLALVAIASVVVWNTVMATLAGIIAASFGFGLSAVLLARATRLSSVSGWTGSPSGSSL